MIGLTVLALMFGWLSGFGCCYGAMRSGDDAELGKWIGRFCAVAALMCAGLALVVTR